MFLAPRKRINKTKNKESSNFFINPIPRHGAHGGGNVALSSRATGVSGDRLLCNAQSYHGGHIHDLSFVSFVCIHISCAYTHAVLNLVNQLTSDTRVKEER